MKGPLSTLAAAALALAAAACSGDPPPASPGPPTPRSSEPPRDSSSSNRRPRTPEPVRTDGAPRVEAVAGDLDVPWDIAFLPDGRALVTELSGRVRLVGRDRRLRSTPLANVPTSAEGEGGLLGIAVDPEFARGRRFVYLYVTTAGGMEVQRWRMAGDRLRLDDTVLGGIAAGSIHDSGRLRFGPDRRLYVATGDAGRRELAQSRGSLNGKFLRLEPREYRDRTTQPTVYSLGHRNPQGLDWQPETRRLFATEHGASGFDGPSGDDEVNVVRRGANYGWPTVRGTSHGRFAAPAHLWAETVAPSGAAFVSLPGSSWTGDLLVAALAGEELHRLEVRGQRVTRDETLFEDEYGRLRAVVEAPDGTIWVTTSNRDIYGSPTSPDDDRILRIIPPRG